MGGYLLAGRLALLDYAAVVVEQNTHLPRISSRDNQYRALSYLKHDTSMRGAWQTRDAATA